MVNPHNGPIIIGSPLHHAESGSVTFMGLSSNGDVSLRTIYSPIEGHVRFGSCIARATNETFVVGAPRAGEPDKSEDAGAIFVIS